MDFIMTRKNHYLEYKVCVHVDNGSNSLTNGKIETEIFVDSEPFIYKTEISSIDEGFITGHSDREQDKKLEILKNYVSGLDDPEDYNKNEVHDLMDDWQDYL